MARIFKTTYPVNGPDGKRVRRKSRKWYIEYRDEQGITRRVAGYTDKAATQQMAAELERGAERGRAGLTDRYDEHRRLPLAKHLEDWEQSVRDGGATEKYVRLSVYRVRQVLEGVRAVYWSDLDPNRVKRYLAERRTEGLSIESSNHYLRRIKQFCRWMVRSRRAAEDPVHCLSTMNARTDRRHQRRAYTDDELRRVTTAAQEGPARRHMPGPERALIYRLSVETGLRLNEIRTLTAGSFSLDDDQPCVTVRAAYSKHRREDVVPVRPVLAADLRAFLHGKLSLAPAFGMPTDATEMNRVLRLDLEKARRAWIDEAETPAQQREREISCFLAYRDGAGRVLDFHALRHTFITNLARGGVHPKIAQELARHSTITLTMDHYTHTLAGDLPEALEVLPDSRPDAAGQKRQKATGTLDAVSGGRSRGLENPSHQEPHDPARRPARRIHGGTAGRKGVELAPDGNQSGVADTKRGDGDKAVARRRRSVDRNTSDTSRHRMAPVGTGDGSGWESNPPSTAKQRFNGFEDRGAHQEP